MRRQIQPFHRAAGTGLDLFDRYVLRVHELNEPVLFAETDTSKTAGEFELSLVSANQSVHHGLRCAQSKSRAAVVRPTSPPITTALPAATGAELPARPLFRSA